MIDQTGWNNAEKKFFNNLETQLQTSSKSEKRDIIIPSFLQTLMSFKNPSEALQISAIKDHFDIFYSYRIQVMPLY